MATLPAHPSLDQLRHQAKDLLRAARSGDAAAAAQIAAVSDRPTLSAAQLAVARSYGFPSWPALKAEVQARAASLDQLAAEFCVASVRDWTGKAVRLLAQTPEIAGLRDRRLALLQRRNDNVHFAHKVPLRRQGRLALRCSGCAKFAPAGAI